MLMLLVSIGVRGQYNPSNPPEPGSYTPTYSLTLKATPAAGGSFNINSPTNYTEGQTINLRAYPASNYTFVSWKENGEVISTTANFTYTMPAGNATLEAEFNYTPGSPAEPAEPNIPAKPVYSTLTLVSDPVGGGYFNISSGNQYEVGSSVGVRAYNNSNFVFQNWTEDGEVVSTSSSFTYVMKETPSTLVAHFTYNPGSPAEPDEPHIYHYHSIFLEADPAAGGYFNISSGNQYQEGSQVRLQAYSNQWYTFQNWTIDDEVVSTSSSYTITIPDHDVSLKAHYTYLYNPGNPAEPSEQPGQLSIYGMTENGFQGQTITYPVFLENPSDVAGIIVDLQFPEGFTVNTQNVALSNRASGHTMAVTDLGSNNYRFSLTGSTAFTGDNGKLFDVKVTIPTTAEMDTSYPVVLTHGVMIGLDESQSTITVRSGNIFVEKVAEDGLYASFSYDKLHGRVLFTNLSSDVARSFVWNFGDGTTSTEREPLHVYQEPGTYVVTLAATGQTDTDVAEMTIFINDRSTWRIDGTFYLADEVTGVRYFTTAQELFQVMASVPFDGNVGLQVMAGKTFSMALSTANIEALQTIQTALAEGEYTLNIGKEGTGNTPILAFGSAGQTINADVVQLFTDMGQSMTCENVDIQLWGISFNPAEYSKEHSQTVESFCPTPAVDFTPISDDLTFKWTLTTETDMPNVPTTDTGNIPVFTPASYEEEDVELDYHIIAKNGSKTFCEFDYKYIITPSPNLGTPDLQLSPAESTVTEGGELALTIATTRRSKKAVTVTLVPSQSDMLNVPKSVVIPSGSNAVDVSIPTIDNDSYHVAQTFTLTAISDGHNDALCTITINDNEQPMNTNQWKLLKQWYAAQNGSAWRNTWTFGSTAAATNQPYGVTMSEGQVTGIDLRNNNLTGNFSPIILQLPQLQSLDLSSNSLTGDFGALIAGALPESMVQQQLTSLDISHNEIKGNIGELGRMFPNLVTLNASYNLIEDVTPALPGTLTNFNVSHQTITRQLTLSDLSAGRDRLAEVAPTVLLYRHGTTPTYDSEFNMTLNDGEGWQTNLKAGPAWAVTGSGRRVWTHENGTTVDATATRDGHTATIAIDFISGDTDFDFLTDIVDLQKDINFALNDNQNGVFNFIAANLMDDNVINVLDMVRLINIMLANGPQQAKGYNINGEATPMRHANETEPVLASVFIDNGQLVLNSLRPVAAMDIVIEADHPRDIKWKANQMTVSRKDTNHSAHLIVYSLMGNEIESGRTILATMGAGNARIVSAQLVERDATRINTSVGEDTVTNGISDISNDSNADDNDAWYTLGGIRLDKRPARPGVYIHHGRRTVITTSTIQKP